MSTTWKQKYKTLKLNGWNGLKWYLRNPRGKDQLISIKSKSKLLTLLSTIIYSITVFKKTYRFCYVGQLALAKLQLLNSIRILSTKLQLAFFKLFSVPGPAVIKSLSKLKVWLIRKVPKASLVQKKIIWLFISMILTCLLKSSMGPSLQSSS